MGSHCSCSKLGESHKGCPRSDTGGVFVRLFCFSFCFVFADGELKDEGRQLVVLGHVYF